MVRLQRGFQRAQVGQKFLGFCIGVLRRDGVARCFAAGQLGQRGGESGIDAGQRAAVRLVLAVLAGVGRAGGQRLHLGAAIDQNRRHRQLAAEQMHFGQIVAQRHVGLAAQRVIQRGGADVRVAVAVAANPLAHAQKAVNWQVAKLAL